MGSDVIAYSVCDAVRASGCSRSRLYIAMRDGELRYVKVGRRTLILRDDLVAWLDRVSQPAPHRRVA